MTRPNILLIIADCLRSDYLTGRQGKAQTPFLDEMGRQGLLFTDMISAMSLTTPNFTSILSGRYPIEHGVRFLTSKPPSTADLSLVPHLKQQGYHTYAFMTGPLFKETGLGHGFDLYHCRDRLDYLDTGFCAEFIKQKQANQFQEPWFILLHLWELHQPRRASPEFHGRSGTPYEKALTSLDRQLEQFWLILREMSERPLVSSLTGDHGEWVETNRLNELWRKGTARLRKLTNPNQPKANWHGYHIYDYLVKVPLLIWGDKIPKTAAPISQQIRQIDLLPTLIEAAGLPAAEPVTGKSVWPLTRGLTISEEPAFLEASGQNILRHSPNWVLGVRHQGWKYFYRPQRPDHQRLFNLQEDPAEKKDLAQQFPQKAAYFKQMIESQYTNRSAWPAEENIDLSTTEQRLRDLGYF